MSNNKAIQILRGTRDKIKDNTTKLQPGQPLYNMDDNYLTVGTKDANGEANKQIDGNVVVSPLIKGRFSDVGSLIETAPTIDNTVDADNKYNYGIYPQNNSLKLQSGSYALTLKDGVLATPVRFEGNLGDSYVAWGGTAGCSSNILSVTDSSLNHSLSANRFAYIINDNNADNGVKIYRATYDYDKDNNSFELTVPDEERDTSKYITDKDVKKKLFSMEQNEGIIHLGDETNFIDADKDCLVAEMNFEQLGLYANIKKFHIYMSTEGQYNCWCRVEYLNYTTVNWQLATENTTDLPGVFINGWSGWNSINVRNSGKNLLVSYNSGNDMSSKVMKLRFIFGGRKDSETNQDTTDKDKYGKKGLMLKKICAFGTTCHGAPNSMARHGHIYTSDMDQNVTFPKNLTVDGNILTLGGNASIKYSKDTSGNETITIF